MASQAPNQPRPYPPPYISNGGVPGGPTPGATPLLPNQGRIIQTGSVRVLCIADVRGNLRSLNELAAEARASAVIHTGDFGFYDDSSLERIAEKTLKHVAQYSPLLPETVKRQIVAAPSQPPVKERFLREGLRLSELPLFLNKTYTLNVPVYTVWGACEDVQVLEKLRSGEYQIPNLNIIDEAHSRLIDVGGVKLRLLGLGGAVVMHKLFDNGEGKTTIAGGQGTMWTTLLQMGELIDTATRVYDPTETRIFVTHASPAREGLLNQLAVTLKADFSVSAGLHFRYGSSYNEFSVNPTLDHYRGKLAASKASFNDVWETVKGEVEPAVADSESQQKLLNTAIEVINKMPSVANGGNPFGGHSGGPGTGQVDESAFKNMWNFNLADAAYGWLVLDIDNGRIGTEMRAQGFNFAHRGGKVPLTTQSQAQSVTSGTAAPAPASSLSNPPAPAPTQNRAPAPSTAASLSQQPQTAQPLKSQNVPSPAAQPVQQVKPATPQPQPARTGPSPVSVPTPATPREPIKPATPQPPVSNATNQPASGATAEKAIPSEVKPNGTAALEKPPVSPAPRQESGPPEKKPSQALFIQNVKDTDEARNIFTDSHRAKILKIEQKGHYVVATFNSTEEMQSALDSLPHDLKTRGGDRSKPNVKIYVDQSERGGFRSRGAGNWQASNRGGTQAGGYRSGGASDSEGGRGGRGGYRGRGGRGSDRGGRGRGRGFKAGDSQTSAAATTPAGGDS